MKETISKFIMAIIAICVSTMAWGQSADAAMQERCKQKVAHLNTQIAQMADKSKQYNTRQYYRTQALKLYIAKGMAYTENGVPKNGVVMEVSSLRTGRTNPRLTRDYFTNLIKLNYTQVVMTFTEMADIKVSNIKRLPDGRYKCVCSYVQRFNGFRDGRCAYKDKTYKSIECYIEEQIIGTDIEYVVMLGDTKVDQTEPDDGNL